MTNDNSLRSFTASKTGQNAYRIAKQLFVATFCKSTEHVFCRTTNSIQRHFTDALVLDCFKKIIASNVNKSTDKLTSERKSLVISVKNGRLVNGGITHQKTANSYRAYKLQFRSLIIM